MANNRDMSAIDNQGEANQLLVRLYGNANQRHRAAVTDNGDVYWLVDEEADRQKVTNRGLEIKAERAKQ